MVIKGEGICKRYGRKRKVVLQDVCFQAKSGECIGILGANGCGKTTLLSILAGFQPSDGGRFLVDGVDLLERTSGRKKGNRIVAYAPQENPLMEELTAWDNLRLWFPGDRSALEQELKTGMLACLGIPEFINVRVSHMSLGMKKRLGIGCAIAGHPKILLLDEPGAALDLASRSQMEEYIERFKREGGILLLATHEEREINLCDRYYLLEDGSLKEYSYHGDIRQLARRIQGEKPLEEEGVS